MAIQLAVPACALSLLVTACGTSGYVESYYGNEFGLAREQLIEEIGRQEDGSIRMLPDGEVPGRNYIARRMRLAMATLADGYVPEFGSMWDDVYVVLRRQGINANVSIPAFFTSEAAATVWRGEPFEQALAYNYVGLHYAMLGSWDNTRAAVQNATFALTSIARDEDGRVLSTQEALQKAAQEEADAGDEPGEEFANAAEEESNFVYGYLMQGIANQQLAIVSGEDNRRAEAATAFKRAAQIDPAVGPLVSRLESGDYNTLLVVDYGRGPEKYGAGPDNAIAAFRPLMFSNRGALLRLGHGDETEELAAVCDVNAMSLDHRWNNREDMRLAKVAIGKALIMAGFGVAAVGNSDDSGYVALGMILAGALLKGSAGADTRYCEYIPQSVYLVPLTLTGGPSSLELRVDGFPGVGLPETTVRLHGLHAPTGRTAQVLYLRLNLAADAQGRSPAYYVAPDVVYGNEYTPDAGRVRKPYILGGHDVRPPTEAVLADYQRAGHLVGWTLDRLEQLYRAEGIVWTMQEARGIPGRHVLEGGRYLITPRPGSMGFQRLMCQEWPPYEATSNLVQEVQMSVATGGSTGAPEE